MRTPPLPHMNPEAHEYREHIHHLGWIMGTKAEVLMRHAEIANDEGMKEDIRGMIDLMKVIAAQFKELEKRKEQRFAPAPRKAHEEEAQA
jgi:hypothetical protein